MPEYLTKISESASIKKQIKKYETKFKLEEAKNELIMALNSNKEGTEPGAPENRPGAETGM